MEKSLFLAKIRLIRNNTR